MPAKPKANIAVKFTISNLFTTLRSLLSSFSSNKSNGNGKLHSLKQMHSLIITSGLSHDPLLFGRFLKICLSLPSFPDAYASSLFNQVNGPHINIWNNMIGGFFFSSQPQTSILFFVKMRRDGVFPNQHTFPLLLKAFSRAKKENPFQIFAQIVKFGFSSDQFVQNSLVSAFARTGRINCAGQLFDEMPHKDRIVYTALIDGYAKYGDAVKALELFVEMRLLGLTVDEVTVVGALCAVGVSRYIWFGRCVHGFYVEPGRICRDVYVDSALVDMYSKCGYCDDALKVFEEMPFRNVVSWTALINGYVQCTRFKDSLFIFENMLLEKVEPNEATLTSVLTACTQVGALDKGRWIDRHICERELQLNSALGTALINMYAKCGCIQEAFAIFEKVTIKDVWLWTAMINGLAMHGEFSRCMKLFSQMVSRGVCPNAVTFICALSACAHGGLLEEGLSLFASMECAYGIQPNIDHYGCIVDLLGRVGHLEKAIKLIEDMPMESSPGIWGALFGACMIHKAYDLGEWIGKHIIDVQPHHSGRYALLANLYSARQDWESAARIRKKMKDVTLEKTPGCSWIELSGTVHEFVAFDSSHPMSEWIYLILDSIALQLKSSALALETNKYC